MAQSLNAKYMQINANKETRMLQPLQLNTPTIIITITTITVQIWYLIKISTTITYLETVFIIFLSFYNIWTGHIVCRSCLLNMFFKKT